MKQPICISLALFQPQKSSFSYLSPTCVSSSCGRFLALCALGHCYITCLSCRQQCCIWMISMRRQNLALKHRLKVTVISHSFSKLWGEPYGSTLKTIFFNNSISIPYMTKTLPIYFNTQGTHTLLFAFAMQRYAFHLNTATFSAKKCQLMAHCTHSRHLYYSMAMDGVSPKVPCAATRFVG